MNKKWLVLLPILAVLTTLGIGGIYMAQASSNGNFNVVDGVLHSYSGTDASILIPASVSTVGKEAFKGNSYIEEVQFSDTVTQIDASAFRDCTSLRSVTIPDSVSTLGDSAFAGCSALSTVNVGKGLRDVGNGAFSDCDSLAAISLSDENPYLSSEGSALFNKEKTRLIQYLAGSADNSYSIPANVSELYPYAFWGCDKLQEVKVNGMASIPDYAFANCRGLKNVLLQLPTNAIGVRSFMGCSALQQVVIPESVGRIHPSAFEGCPEDLLFVCGLYSYAQRYADEHFYPTSESVLYETAYPVEQSSTATTETETTTAATTGDTATNTPEGSTEAEGSEEDNDSSSLRITSEGVILGNTPVVSGRAYVQLGSNELSVIDASAQTDSISSEKTITDHAHYLDQTLTSYEFPSTLEEIGDFAFARTRLTVVNLPEGLKSIGEGSFYHCDLLSEVNIPSSVNHIGKNAFNFTPWYQNWEANAAEGDLLIVGDGVLIGIKGERPESLPDTVKTIADGVF